jgi:predicted ATPase with chaperone activity
MLNSISLKELLAEPQTIEDLQIPQNIVIDIILRLLYNEGNVTFKRIIQVAKIPSAVNKLLDWLRQEHLIEISPASFSQGPLSYIYKLTNAGVERAKDALERSQYVGPTPVPIHYYNRAIELQTQQHRKVSINDVKKALQGLVLDPEFHRQIGPAVNSADSLFLYGPSGNGKTSIALRIADLIASTSPIWIPFALTAGGQIIQIHDRLVHKHAPADAPQRQEMGSIDGRWELVQRPSIMVGGELKMDALDLRFDSVSKIYEAPLQLKANGGMFLIDDFGRQQVSPVDLLNRWIVPLEESVDYLRLRTGQTVVVPFRQLIVFSTNLDPYKLADDAFYRRIQIKVAVSSPNETRFREIFIMVCQQFNIPFDENTYNYLLESWYHKAGRALQSVHPRDLLKIVQALCEYDSSPSCITPKLIDEACLSYFVNPTN